ncbi:MAG: phospholipid/glycerol acyltransferase [Polaromonas sp.]|nr:phospholipid/glycerol acyltransferase [Polaromonas sp.]
MKFVPFRAMDSKADVLPKGPGSPSRVAGRPPLHQTLRMVVAYGVLSVMCLGFSAVAIGMLVVLPRATSRRVGRAMIGSAFRAYLGLLTWMGACRFDLSELDALRTGPAVVLAPNHPCLLDAIMILSRLPDASCIMKTELVNNIFFGAGARLGGYIRNTPIRSMILQAIVDLHEGTHVLLFPEGTRSACVPVSPLQGTTGLVAKYAGASVQTIFIETNSAFLGKGWSLLWTPDMPVTYRVRLGRRFDPPADTVAFTAELQDYFAAELAHAGLPQFPASAGSR